jgi:hypothetical protein
MPTHFVAAFAFGQNHAALETKSSDPLGVDDQQHDPANERERADDRLDESKRYGGCLLCRRAGARVEWQE